MRFQVFCLPVVANAITDRRDDWVASCNKLSTAATLSSRSGMVYQFRMAMDLAEASISVYEANPGAYSEQTLRALHGMCSEWIYHGLVLGVLCEDVDRWADRKTCMALMPYIAAMVRAWHLLQKLAAIGGSQQPSLARQSPVLA